MGTAAAVVIGDEILSGKFPDENGPFLIGRLREIGVDLRRLATIGDDVEGIAEEVRLCSGRFDHVFTTGGVGPTHDDLTLEGVARAFGVPLEERAELVALLDQYGLPRNEAALRMARIPAGSELVPGARGFPTVRVRNVWVFPGVPKLFRVKFEAIQHHLVGSPVRAARLYTREMETDIAERLTTVQRAWPTVAIGSYPRWEERYAVMVTLESRDEAALDAAVAALRAVLALVEP